MTNTTSSLIDKFEKALADAEHGIAVTGSQRLTAVRDTWKEAISLILQHEAEQPADVVERVARAIHDNDPEHGIYCWAKYGKTHYMPMAKAAIAAMGGAGPQLTDARPDASEVRGSVARPMEESPPANPRHVTPEEDAILHKALLASVDIIHPVNPETLSQYKEAVDFIYASIGRDFGHLSPLDAAKHWMERVLEEAPELKVSSEMIVVREIRLLDRSEEEAARNAILEDICHMVKTGIIEPIKINAEQLTNRVMSHIWTRLREPSPKREVIGWKPIDTAPKDGKEILLYCDDEEIGDQLITPGRWQKYDNDQNFWSPEWDFGVVATHWMPLPSAPVTKSKDGAGR